MLLEEIKNEISKRYPGKAWKDKVKGMKYNQAYAIFMRFKKEDEKEKEDKKEEFHQITIYEYLMEKKKKEEN